MILVNKYPLIDLKPLMIDKTPQMGWLDDFKVFSGETSAHGVKYIFHGSHKIVKTFFLLGWILAIGYCMYVISRSIDNFVGRPTGTKFQVVSTKANNDRDSVSPSSITFPTVSVCSHNVVSKSYLARNEHLEELFEHISYNISGAKHIDFENPPYNKYKDLTYEQVMRDGGPPDWNMLQCEKFVDHCHADHVLGNNTYDREPSLSGNCWRINPQGLLKVKGGDYGKVQLMFFADLNEYSSITRREPEHGFTVVFHDKETYSSTIPSGFWMSPGAIYKVDLSMHQEYREPPPAGHCDPLLVNNTYGRYEENSCVAQCRDDFIMATCGCVHITPPVPQNRPETNYSACTLQQWAKCGAEMNKQWVSDYVRGEKVMCNCPPSCFESLYRAQLSSSVLSKFYAEEKSARLPPGYNNGAADVMENLLIIDVLFTSMQVNEIKEIVTYGWGNFLGDVGGVLGLLLGASAFTIIEFAQFTIFAVAKYCFGWSKKREPKHVELKETSVTDTDYMS